MRVFISSLLVFFLFAGCDRVPDLAPRAIKKELITENVFIVVVDGPRLSETWRHPEKVYIPNLANRLVDVGVYNEEFYNFGLTKTIPGHTAIITGVYENLYNNGLQFPTYPSILQQWLFVTRNDPMKAWIITSKDKLNVLGNCSHLDWRNNFTPAVNAEYRSDVDTYRKIIEVLDEHKPNMLFVNFREPDSQGHADNWPGYLKAIRLTDSLVNNIYDYIQQDSVYAGKTTLIMTNDHGRHLDGIRNEFVSHGDQCEGCTHINFFATGPDFKEGAIVNTQREQIDIAPTAAKLMGFEIAETEGEVMTELFK